MAGLNGVTGSQDKTQNSYIDAFKNQIASQPSTTQAYQTGQQIYNVQPLQDTANALTNTMLNTPNNNLNASRGFNVDAGQISQQNSQDLQRLAPAQQAAQNNATTAQQNATNYANLQYEQNQMNILPEQQQQAYLMQQYAAQQTGWTTAQADQLSALQAKMTQGVALSAAEQQSYASLANAEASYQGAIQAAQTTANASMANAKTQYQNQIIGQGGSYFNPTTKQYYTPNVGAGTLS